MAKASLRLQGTQRAWAPDVREGVLKRPEGTQSLVSVRITTEPSTSEALARGRAAVTMLGQVRDGLLLPLEAVLDAGGRVAWVYSRTDGVSAARVLELLRARAQVLPSRVAVELVAAVADALAAVFALDDGTWSGCHVGAAPDQVLVRRDGSVRLAGATVKGPGGPVEARPGYRPPEGGTGHGTYMAGALLVELLTGEAPPAASPDPARHEQVIRRAVIQVMARPGDIPGEMVGRLLQRTLAYDRHARGSVAELARTLRELAARLPGAGPAGWLPEVVGGVIRATAADASQPPTDGALPSELAFESGGRSNGGLTPPPLPPGERPPGRAPPTPVGLRSAVLPPVPSETFAPDEGTDERPRAGLRSQTWSTDAGEDEVGPALGGPALGGGAAGPALTGPALGGLAGPALGGFAGPALGGGAAGPLVDGPRIGGAPTARATRVEPLGGANPSLGGPALGGPSLGGASLGDVEGVGAAPPPRPAGGNSMLTAVATVSLAAFLVVAGGGVWWFFLRAPADAVPVASVGAAPPGAGEALGGPTAAETLAGAAAAGADAAAGSGATPGTATPPPSGTTTAGATSGTTSDGTTGGTATTSRPAPSSGASSSGTGSASAGAATAGATTASTGSASTGTASTGSASTGTASPPPPVEEEPGDEEPVRIVARVPTTDPGATSTATSTAASTGATTGAATSSGSTAAAADSPGPFRVSFAAGDPSVTALDVRCLGGSGAGAGPVVLESIPKGTICKITGTGADAPLLAQVTVNADRTWTCFRGRARSCQ